MSAASATGVVARPFPACDSADGSLDFYAWFSPSSGVEQSLVQEDGSHADTNGPRGTLPFPSDPAAPWVGSDGARSDAGTSASAASGTVSDLSNS